jgi:nitrogen regulatory protein PII
LHANRALLHISAPKIGDNLLDAVIEKSARTGKIGDGKIFVAELGQAFRVRTGETGEAAL